jgi:hypothetical protein
MLNGASSSGSAATISAVLPALLEHGLGRAADHAHAIGHAVHNHGARADDGPLTYPHALFDSRPDADPGALSNAHPAGEMGDLYGIAQVLYMYP